MSALVVTRQFYTGVTVCLSKDGCTRYQEVHVIGQILRIYTLSDVTELLGSTSRWRQYYFFERTFLQSFIVLILW
jgi:hypothetical protein